VMDNKEAVALYRTMELIRRFEERVDQANKQNKFAGYLHLYIGQEAIAAGFLSALKSGDLVSTSYRDHAHYIQLGGDIKSAMAEIWGKGTGCSKGMGGSMHLFDVERGFLGGTGIVGASVPLGTGAGLALKYKGTDNISVCFFGDGAMNTGVFHESLNMAGLYDLPIVFICENNKYAMWTSVERSHAVTDLSARACAYGMKTYDVDGQDMWACRDLAERVYAEVRATNRPVFIEALTYRYRAHGAIDLANYRTREEIAEWQKRDPILLARERLMAEGALTEEDVERIRLEVRAEVDEAWKFAEESPQPTWEMMHELVYA
jgi:pyruvate dehydrogenase E1 component alpha subunit